jgi:two-component system sensor histidine kinase YesM
MIGVSTFVLSLIASYFVIIPFLRNRAIEKADQANREIIQNMDSLSSYVEDYTENLVLSVESTPKILEYFTNPTKQNRNIASLNLNKLISYEGVVRCVIIENDKGVVLDSLNNITNVDFEVLGSEWYQSLHKAEYGRGFSGVYQTTRNNRTYYSAAYLKNFYYNNHLFSYVAFFDLNGVIFDTQVIADNTLDYYMLVDAEQNVFYSTGREEWQNSINRYVSDVNSSGKYIQESNGISLKKASINNKWYVVSFMSNSTIFKLFQNYVINIVLIMLLFLVITLVSLPRVLSRIAKRISNLSTVMATASLGNLDCRV